MGFSWTGDSDPGDRSDTDLAPGSTVQRPLLMVLAFLLWTVGFLGALFGIWALAITGILTGTIAASRS